MIRRIVQLSLTGLLVLSAGSALAASWYQYYGIRTERELVDPVNIPKLEVALSAADEDICVEVLEAFRKMGKASLPSVPRMLPLLAHEEPAVKLKAINTLYDLGYLGGDFLEHLSVLRSDGNRKVRARAIDIHRALSIKIDFASPKAAPEQGRAPAKVAAVESGAVDFKLPQVKKKNTHGIAIIIGNRNYEKHGKGVPDVAYAQNDSDLIYRFVIESMGFREGNVIHIKDATQADLVSLFGNERSFQGRAYDYVRANQSDLFVYYSGHGAPGLRDGAGYLLPVDVDPNKVEFNGFPLSVLYSNLEKIPARTRTVVLDACFSGASQAGTVVKNASSVSLVLKDIAPPTTGLTVLAAAGTAEVASWDDEKHHGLFTRYLIEGAAGAADHDTSYGNNDGAVSLKELKNYLEGEVTYSARRRYGRDQTPQVSGDNDIFMAMWKTVTQEQADLLREELRQRELGAEQRRQEEEQKARQQEELRARQAAEQKALEETGRRSRERRLEEEQQKAQLERQQREAAQSEAERSRRERVEAERQRREQQRRERELERKKEAPPSFTPTF